MSKKHKDMLRLSFFSTMLQHRYAKLVLLVLAALLVAVAGYALCRSMPQGSAPTTFGECAARYKVSGTFPRTCAVPLGKTFVEYAGNVPQVDGEVRVIDLPPAPVLNASPLMFSGEALPSWFNKDGTLTVQLVAGSGRVLASAQVPQDKSSGLPVSPGYNRFSATIDFTPPAPGTQGALIIKKSGTQQALVLPVVF